MPELQHACVQSNLAHVSLCNSAHAGKWRFHEACGANSRILHTLERIRKFGDTMLLLCSSVCCVTSRGTSHTRNSSLSSCCPPRARERARACMASVCSALLAALRHLTEFNVCVFVCVTQNSFAQTGGPLYVVTLLFFQSFYLSDVLHRSLVGSDSR